MRVLVTGATGFIGSALASRLGKTGFDVVRASRRPSGDSIVVGAVDGRTDWSLGLRESDAVVHLAARVHKVVDDAVNPLAEFRAVNVEGTLNLARQAASAGVRRFLYLSSVKVNGEGSSQPYTEDFSPAPKGPYAISKWEAEQGLCQIGDTTGMEVVIIRPPLVYGPGVGANFLRLMRLVDRGAPLPFGAVRNSRSLLYLGNLLDVVIVCLTHPAAANKTYLVSDSEDVSTPDLISLLAANMGKSARLLPIPVSFLGLVAGILGRREELHRVVESLVVDSSKIRRELGWVPPYPMTEGVAKTVEWFHRSGVARS